MTAERVEDIRTRLALIREAVEVNQALGKGFPAIQVDDDLRTENRKTALRLQKLLDDLVVGASL